MELSTERMGPMSEVTFIYDVYVGHNTLANHGWRPDPKGARGPTVNVS
jgi:hypothetical protein